MGWIAVFPGQGSQSVGMGKFLFDNFKIARECFEEASDTLSINFKELCFNGSESDLQLTHNTQPALLLVSTATFRVFQANADFVPQLAAGHSVGEYAAMVTAGVVSFKDAMISVRRRGEAMQNAVPVGQGGMCAVMGLTDTQVRELCLWVEKESKLSPLEPANFNSPGQVVISGDARAISWMLENFKKEVLSNPPSRAKFIPLKVSAPFHCSMMEPAEKTMGQLLNQIAFNNSNWPIVQNVTATAQTTAIELRKNIIRQITAPVLWSQSVSEMIRLGASKAIEFGSGRVLAGLIKKIDSEKIQTFNLESLDDLKNVEATYATQR